MGVAERVTIEELSSIEQRERTVHGREKRTFLLTFSFVHQFTDQTNPHKAKWIFIFTSGPEGDSIPDLIIAM